MYDWACAMAEWLPKIERAPGKNGKKLEPIEFCFTLDRQLFQQNVRDVDTWNIGWWKSCFRRRRFKGCVGSGPKSIFKRPRDFGYGARNKRRYFQRFRYRPRMNQIHRFRPPGRFIIQICTISGNYTVLPNQPTDNSGLLSFASACTRCLLVSTPTAQCNSSTCGNYPQDPMPAVKFVKPIMLRCGGYVSDKHNSSNVNCCQQGNGWPRGL